MATSIQWTNETWNPVTGCTKVSQGCKHCYAERIFPRVYGKFRRFTDVQCHPDRLQIPLKWKQPRMIFVNSMSDLFHEKIPDAFVGRIFEVIAQCPQHTFQILTKRPERIAKVLGPNGCGFYAHEGSVPCPQPNAWIGTSVENQDTADVRIPAILNAPSALRWISAEPLLGPVDLSEENPDVGTFSWLEGFQGCDPPIPRLDWVVIGGESGPNARLFDLRWAYDLVAQCKAYKVPVFVKQLGRNPMFSGGSGQAALCNLKLQDNHGGEMSEWPEDLRIREFPKTEN